LADRIWSPRNNLGPYDACFIGLAQPLDAPLITADALQATGTLHHARRRVTDRPTAFMAPKSNAPGTVMSVQKRTRSHAA